MTGAQKFDCTEVRTDQFTYQWKIKNFKLFHHKRTESLKSPSFIVGNNDVKWCLKLYPQGHGMCNEGFISLYLCLESLGSAQFELSAKYEFSILHSATILVEQEILRTFKNLEGYGEHNFIKREELLAACKFDDSFIIKCKIEQASTLVTKSMSCVTSCNSGNHRLIDDCRQLVKQQNQFTDVTIVVGNVTFSAHKVFLATRSSVFAAMFSHQELKENCTNEVKIDDFEPKIIEAMLEFIYTDQVSDLAKLADKLIAAAQKYGLELLKAMCEEALCQKLDTENAIEILELADLYDCSVLTEYAIQFVANHFSEVMKSEGYEKTENPRVLKKLLRINDHEKLVAP